MLSIGELAERSGITVRALRYYETKNLINPMRSEAGQRVYKYPDIVRLQQIQLLKRAGFTLSQIATMMGDAAIEARNILRIQKGLLEKQLAHSKASLAAIETAIDRLDESPTDLFTLCNMIKIGESVVNEDNWKKVWDKFYTDEEQARWKKAKEAIPKDIQQACEENWPKLIARTEALLGTNPASDEAQAILKEWNAMTQTIYDIDPSLTKSAARLYDKMDEWPDGSPQSPFSSEVWAFIKAADQAGKK